MKELLKKLTGMILAVCLMIPMLGTVVFAADGVLMFSDPSTQVGENVSVDLVVQSSDGSTVGNVNVTMSYDTSALEFVSGDGFTADGSGTLTYTGTGSSSELRATMTFRALTATDTSLTVSSSSATVSSGETLNLEQGSSAISIAAADDGTTSVEPTTASGTAASSTDIVVTVDGTDYNFSEAFTTADIPEGYTETTMTFNGEERRFVVNEAGIYLGYLVDGSGSGSFFLFDTENATFLPYMELSISDSTSIIPLDGAGQATMPDNYQEVDIDISVNGEGRAYQGWNDPEIARYYIIYALNTRTGAEGLYQYDTEDGTYQYFEAPAQAEEDTAEPTFLDRLGDYISSHILLFLVAAAVVFLLLLIFMIVFAVKLVHRNQELDDLYDEYDIPFDDEDESKEKNGKSSQPDKKDLYDDEDDGYSDDDYDEDDYEDDGYDDDYTDDYDDEDYDYEDDVDYEDDEEEPEDRKKSSRKGSGRKQKGSSGDDDFDINFIDL